MTSKESDEKTENYPAVQLESLNIDGRLANLDGPFNWHLYGMSSIENEEKSLKRGEEQVQMIIDRQDYFPELIIIYHLLQAFGNTVDDELPSAVECINEAEQCLADIIQKEALKDAENVLQHLVMGTKCHVLKKLGRLTEVDELLKEILDIDDMNETELAMLIGCHGLALSLFTTDNFKGINCAKAAMKHDPNNGKWHYLLGQNYRDSRRQQFSPIQWPHEEEALAFQEAYRLSPNVLFGSSLAQLYRESKNYDMANKIYKEVHALQPTSLMVRFQLALGFIRAQECELAKECLDYIAEKMPCSTRYSHYMGIYHEKCNKDFKAALPYYQSTTDDLNHAAEWQYVECRKKVEPDWDPLPYLLGLLKKYEKFVDYIPQEINIQIGSYYLFEMHDIPSACKYLTEAIEIRPSNKRLRNHSLLFRKSEQVNLYHALAKEVQFALQIGTAMYDDHKITVLKNALELCHKNCLDLTYPPAFFRTQAPRTHLSNSRRNDECGSSSDADINWRERGSSSLVQGFSGNQNPRRSDVLNSPKRLSGSSYERDYTSWRSEKREPQGRQDEHHLSSTFKDKRDSTGRIKGSSVHSTAFSKRQNKKDDSEASASCHLVKTVKNLNL